MCCGVAKLVRHRIVNPAIEGSNPSATANSLLRHQLVRCELIDGRLANCKVLIQLVPRVGVEPTRPYGQRILSLKSLVPACMPKF